MRQYKNNNNKNAKLGWVYTRPERKDPLQALKMVLKL